MRKDREFYSFFIQTLQTSSSLICQMFLFLQNSAAVPCLWHFTTGVLWLCYHFHCFHVDTYTVFFFVFVFQFYILHPVRSWVLYHSFSVNFDCYPFFLFPFSFFFFFFYFSSLSKMHRRCSCRGEEMLCLLSCSGWVLQWRAQVQLFFFFGVFVEADWKKLKGRKA